MKVQTPLVVLSYSRQAILDFFSNANGYGSINKAAKETNDVFLLDSANSGFISLRQKLGRNSLGLIELKVLDIPGNLEERLFRRGLNGALKLSKDLDLNLSPKSSAFEDFTWNPSKPSNPNFIQEEVVEAFENYADQFRKNYKGDSIYIAFGSGKNINWWNGPYETALVKAELDITSSKIVTLFLQPNAISLSTVNPANFLREKARLDTKGNKLEIIGKSGLIDLEKFDKSNSVYDSPFLSNKDKNNGLSSRVSSQFLKSIDPKVISFLSKIDLHILVCDVIRSYLRTATNSDRVIVLLPNLNEILSEMIVSLYESNYVKKLPVSRFYKILRKILEILCISLVARNIKIYDLITRPTKALVEELAINEMNDSDFPKNFVGKLQDHFSRYKYIAKIKQSFRPDEIIDYKIPLVNIFNNIYNESGGKIKNLFTHYEHNVKVIDYWSELKEYPIFRSISDNKGSNSAVVVFGDESLVKSYLLGDKSTKDTEGLSNVSLHPSDIEILGDQKYRETIRTINKFKLDLTDSNYLSLYDSSFDSFSLLSTEINNQEDKAKLNKSQDILNDFVRQNSIPVFRYGIKNPNVGKLNHKFNSQYFSELQSIYSRDFATLTSITSSKAFIDKFYELGIVPQDLVNNYIENRMKLDNSVTPQEVAKELATQFSTNNMITEDPKEIGACIKEFSNKLIKNNELKSISIPQGVPLKKEELVYDFAKQMYGKAKTINLETLPFFHLGPERLMSDAFVFAEIPSILKSTKSKRSRFSQFISGHYKIIEIEHVIDSNAARTNISLLEVGNISKTEDPKKSSDTMDLTEKELYFPAELDVFGAGTIVPPV